MFFLLLVSILSSWTPYLLLIDGSIAGRGKIKMASASTLSLNEPARAPHFSPHRKAKAMIKGTISGRMLSSDINHVAFALVYSEKTRLKKCWIMIIIIITNKLQETTVFHGRQKLTSTMKQRPEK